MDAKVKARDHAVARRIADTSAQDTLLEPRSTRGRWLVAGAAVTVVVALAFTGYPAISRWLAAEQSIARERLLLATVSRGDFVRDISVEGRVVASVSPVLYATQTGTITFDVAAGDIVEVGTALGQVDSPELANELKTQKSVLAKSRVTVEREDIEARQKRLTNKKNADVAQLALNAADREFRRAQEAFSFGGISEIDYQKAKDDLESAQYAYEHAAADAELDNERLNFEARTRLLELEQQELVVEELQRKVDELTLISPVSGIVGNLLVEQKATVSKNMPVVSVVDLSQFEIEALVPESYADELALGMPAELRSGADRYGATLISISPEIIDNHVTTRLRFEGSPPEGLRQNQRLTARILLEEKRNVLMVSRGQFLESGSGRIAWRVDGDLARKQSIQTGARSLNQVEILSGLAEGDTIIVSSTEVFENATTIQLTD